jgi:DNA-binding MurR/RpiR family transcriptional regulator
MRIRKAEAQYHVAGSGDLIEELRRQYDRLTQSQKGIAEYVVEHSQEVAFSTVDQMAERLDVNPSTIVRFTYRLGLNGFTDLQERMEQLVRGQLSPVPATQSAKSRPPAIWRVPVSAPR